MVNRSTVDHRGRVNHRGSMDHRSSVNDRGSMDNRGSMSNRSSVVNDRGSVDNRCCVVGGCGVRDSVWVSCGAVVGHLRYITVDGIGVVVDVLRPAVRQVDRVGTLCIACTVA